MLRDILSRTLLYCDGACSPNPGLGGWAAVLLAGGRRQELSGAVPDTTNNRMELYGAIRGLQALRRRTAVTIHTDSLYVLKAFEHRWVETWQGNGWLTSARKPVENQDLWRELIALVAGHDVRWTWVNGHADDEEHNRCDTLAVSARLAARTSIAEPSKR
jgi:ribonuclease HI